PATSQPAIYTLSLHDALPICAAVAPSFGAGTMNEVYRNLTLVRAQATVAAARAFSGVDHRGLEGHLREIVMRDLLRPLLPPNIGDRKSTRLNSSHVAISYAVF